MNIGFVGCGALADLYMQSLGSHLDLRMVGAFDPDPDRRAGFHARTGEPVYDSLDALLAVPSLDIVVVLAPLDVRADVTREALEAGKHVFSAAPLAPTPQQAGELEALAQSRKLCLGVGPATHLSESVQTLGRALRAGTLGTPLMVQADMTMGPAAAGLIGAETLTDYGHLVVAPLVQLFGPVQRVAAMAERRVAADGGPDLAIGTLEFSGGLLARVTLATFGPQNRALRVVGSSATATLADVVDVATQARIAKTLDAPVRKGLARLEDLGQRWAPGLILGSRMTPARPVTMKRPKMGPAFDAARGIAALTEAVRGGPNRVETGFAFHVADVVQALMTAPGGSLPVAPKTTLAEVPAPMSWAE